MQRSIIAPDAEKLATPLAHALQHLPNIEVLANYTVTEVIGTTTVEELVIARDRQIRRLSVLLSI